MSSLLADTAESWWYWALRASAYIFAKVVLPTPGGPNKIKDSRCFFAMAISNGFPFPTKCLWPINSAKFLGLILNASGSIFYFSHSFLTILYQFLNLALRLFQKLFRLFAGFVRFLHQFDNFLL